MEGGRELFEREGEVWSEREIVILREREREGGSERESYF